MAPPGRRERGGERPQHAGQQQEPAGVAPQRRVTHGGVEHQGEREREQDAERERPGLAEHELAQRPHQAGASACRAVTAATCTCAAATNASARYSSAASPAGHSTPRPSPRKNTPKLDSTTPTAYLRCDSGNRASGRCRTAPSAITNTTATAAPATAGA